MLTYKTVSFLFDLFPNVVFYLWSILNSNRFLKLQIFHHSLIISQAQFDYSYYTTPRY